MARPNNISIDSFSIDVNLMDDTRIRRLIRMQNGPAVLVYIVLLCDIYRQGYYLWWSDDYPFRVSEQTGLSEGYVLEVLKCCTRVGLLSADAWHRHHVLTSYEIQQRYIAEMKQTRRRRIIMDEMIVDERNMLVGVASEAPDAVAVVSTPSSVGKHAEVGKKGAKVSSAITGVFVQNKGVSSAITPVSSAITPVNVQNKGVSSAITPKAAKEKESSPHTPYKEKENSPMQIVVVNNARAREEKSISLNNNREPESEQAARARVSDGVLSVREGELMAALRGDMLWRDTLCLRYGIDPFSFEERVDAFALDCKCRVVYHQDEADAKRHFVNWLAKQLDLEKQKQNDNQQKPRSNEGNSKGRSARRRGVDAAVRDPEAYEGAF